MFFFFRNMDDRPMMRFRYLVTVEEEQVQGLVGLPYQPLGRDAHNLRFQIVCLLKSGSFMIIENRQIGKLGSR